MPSDLGLPPLLGVQKFDRFGLNVPDLDPPGTYKDTIAIAARFHDGEKTFSTQRIDDLKFSYARYGITQPFSFTTSFQALQALLRKNDRRDVFEWLTQAEDKLIQAEVFVRSPGTAGHDAFVAMQKGFLDVTNSQFHNDHVRIVCRDNSARLWETPLFGVTINPPVGTEFAKQQATFADIDTQGQDFDGNTIDTIRPILNSRPVGICDTTGVCFRVDNGTRAWDVVQQGAFQDNADCFTSKGTLWYISPEEFAAKTGRFYLTQGKNLKSLDVEHSPFQSKDITLVMAIAPTHRTVGADTAPESATTGTTYIVVSGQGRLRISNFPPKEGQGQRRFYRVVRHYNDPDFTPLVNEAVALHRQLLAKEFVINATMAGHIFADSFSTYVLRGTTTTMDETDFLPQHIEHTLSLSQGWTTSITGVNAAQTQAELAIERAAPEVTTGTAETPFLQVNP